MEKGWESMNTAQRRTEILKLLQQEEKPVAARAMASQFGVSRQVIVQDIALIRAAGYECDTCIYTGNPVNDQRICVAAG